MPEMPRYKCHKEVRALKISTVYPVDPDGGVDLGFSDEGYTHILRHVSAEYVRKHNPQPEGYFVVYDDGYESWSPARAFEEGYTRIE
jgi:hypothetical protein